MNSINSILLINFVFEKLQQFLLKEEKILIDYYILACLLIPSNFEYKLSTLFDKIEIDLIKNSNNWDIGYEKILFQKEFHSLKFFLENTQRKLNFIYNKETNLEYNLKEYENYLKKKNIKRDSSYIGNKKDINYEKLYYYDFDTFSIQKMGKEINLIDENIYLYIHNIIIGYKSIDSLIAMYKDKKYFDQYYEDQQNHNDEKEISLYENMKNKIKKYMFYPLCNKSFSSIFDNLSVKIINMNWDIDESNILYNISEANFYIENLLDFINEMFDNIVIYVEIENPIKYFHDFLDIICMYLNDKFMESYSKIKKVKNLVYKNLLCTYIKSNYNQCSSLGRSIMLKDVKTMIDKIEEIYIIK